MSYYGAKAMPAAPPGMLGALMGGTAPSVTPGAAPPGAAPGAVTAGAALFGAALGAAPGTAPPGAAPGAAPGSLNITGDQMLYLMNMMSGGKGPPSRRAHSGRGGSRAGSSTQTGSGGGGATRRHRRSTSDTFSPAWTCMGDISPDDKVTSLKCLQPLVGDLRLRQEWELDCALWRSTGKGPFDPLLSRSKPEHNEELRIEYLRFGSPLHYHMVDELINDTLVLCGPVSPPVVAQLADCRHEDRDAQKLVYANLEIVLSECTTGSTKWHLGSDPQGAATSNE